MLKRSNLRIWQIKAAAIAASRSVLISAAPGAGKTPTMLTAIADGLTAGNFHRVLLVAPRAILESVFAQEAARWDHTAHLRISMTHRLGPADRMRAWFEDPAQIITCTPDTLHCFVETMLARGTISVDAIFVDEAQAFKDPSSIRSQALQVLARAVKIVVMASGTPTPNGPQDAWVPGTITNPANQFWRGNFFRWRAKHFRKSGTFGWIPHKGAEELIHAELAKSALAIKLREQVDIPPEIYTNQPFEFESEHRDRILSFRNDQRIEIDGNLFGAEEGDDPGFLQRFQQLTQGFAYLGDETKILSMRRVEALRDVIESVEGPVLVSVKYRADFAMIRRLFPNVVAYSGNTPHAERADIIARWNRDEIPILCANPATIGVGLNLQHGSAQSIVWFCGTWSHEQFVQMNARLIRSGQRRVISIVSIQSSIGIDQAIAAVLERKQSGEKALMAALDISHK